MHEERAVQAVIHLYVDGMTFAHEAALRKAFHPKASIIGNYGGRIEWLSLNDFIGAITSEGPAPAGTQPLIQIEALDVTGDAATVKVVDEFAGMRFSDYLALLKIDGRWVIVNKLYHLHS
ncbi:nuclear transport factor 2 family protein [Rhizobium sp. XQZ8]|uniref:nuclear transport factor 2 family protein n=1 Tax=Rhizobium populisoli TaxID=2859785 RepID=UPI001C677716|nr:nuclear transport factor 2 family protein [Rhizobium populisoli]MBW6423473.1 nuclear transport factor 2 family protein [Rhizobium populisoli]